MLSFLNPSLLWALPLAAAPILLHLLFLRRARRVEFSDLELLRAAHRRSLPSTRLRRWLLLLLRCCLLAALVAAFARPVLHPRSAGALAQEGGLDAAVLVDTSWSMRAEERGKPRFDLALAAAGEFVRMLRPNDRAAVAGFSKGLDGELRWSESFPAAAEAVGRLRCGWRTTDLSSALAAAYALLSPKGAGAGRRRVLLLLTDNSRHLARSLGPAGLRGVDGYDPGVLVLGLKWGAGIANAGIRGAEGACPASSGEPGSAELCVRAESFGMAGGKSSLDAWVKGRLAGQRAVSLGEAAPAEAFRLPVPADGEVFGRFDLRPDALSADDRLFFSWKVEPPPRVLYAYGGPDSLEAGRSGYFFNQLLAPGGRLPFRMDASDLGRLPRIPLEDYSAVIVDEAREVHPEAAEALKRFVLRGGGLWLVAGTRSPGPLSSLEGILPARLGPEVSSRASGLLPEPGFGPAQAGLRGFDLDNVVFQRRYSLETLPESRVLARDGAQAPLLVERAAGLGRSMLWASSFDVRWTNLALKGAFVALVEQALSRLTGFEGGKSSRNVLVGEPFAREWGPKERAPAKAEVVSPDGRRTAVAVRENRAVFSDTRFPGLYSLRPSGSGAQEAFAVNADRSSGEGDARSADVPWRLLRPEALREDFLLAVYGREARTAVLALALLLLGLEFLLDRPRGAAGVLLLLALLPSGARAQEGDRFVWAQARTAGAWDPYPGAYAEVLKFLGSVTSVLSSGERRVLDLKDPLLFSTPFLFLAGAQAPAALDDEEVRGLRDYLVSGGFLWLDDSSPSSSSGFDRWARASLAEALPDSPLKPLGPDHVLFKTFFLVRRAGGRSLVSGSVEGVEWGGRTVAVYTRNDVLGAWARDPLGKPLFECVPGGEAQRLDARKLTLNILMYSLTSSYKADAVHQPFILEKMRQGFP
jgi:hypothetical protein